MCCDRQESTQQNEKSGFKRVPSLCIHVDYMWISENIYTIFKKNSGLTTKVKTILLTKCFQ